MSRSKKKQTSVFLLNCTSWLPFSQSYLVCTVDDFLIIEGVMLEKLWHVEEDRDEEDGGDIEEDPAPGVAAPRRVEHLVAVFHWLPYSLVTLHRQGDGQVCRAQQHYVVKLVQELAQQPKVKQCLTHMLCVKSCNIGYVFVGNIQ